MIKEGQAQFVGVGRKPAQVPSRLVFCHDCWQKKAAISDSEPEPRNFMKQNTLIVCAMALVFVAKPESAGHSAAHL